MICSSTSSYVSSMSHCCMSCLSRPRSQTAAAAQETCQSHCSSQRSLSSMTCPRCASSRSAIRCACTAIRKQEAAAGKRALGDPSQIFALVQRRRHSCNRIAVRRPGGFHRVGAHRRGPCCPYPSERRIQLGLRLLSVFGRDPYGSRNADGEGADHLPLPR